MNPAAAVAGFVGLAGAAASARWAWWRTEGSGLPILMYHKVGPTPSPSRLPELWVTERQFRWQMRYLKRRGYAAVTFGDLEAARSGERPLPDKPVMITFDDGYQNNYTLAYPVLKELGLKANLFLVHETIGRHNEWHDPADEPWQRMVTWAQAREMAASGVFEYANHTMRHARLDRVSIEDARWQVAEAKKRLEDRLGAALPAFAYPYGAGAELPQVRDEVLAAGHTLDFGIRPALSRLPMGVGEGPLPEALPRLFIRGDEYRFDFHLKVTRGRSKAFA